MFGLGDWQIAAALIGCVGITLFGVIYGSVNWNRGSDPRKEEASMRVRRRARRRKSAKERA
ncbi:MAG: hypothetical protein LBM70_08675 [Victivallales bacterium]|jgi:hypothetical protein|nr:hypothetical protein [Victivallales bacterium]